MVGVEVEGRDNETICRTIERSNRDSELQLGSMIDSNLAFLIHTYTAKNGQDALVETLDVSCKLGWKVPY